MRRSVVRFVAVAALGVVTLAACGSLRDRDRETPHEPAPAASPGGWEPTAYPCIDAGGHADGCDVPGYDDRPFDVYVPVSYDPSAQPMPVVIFLHGGGGNSVQTQETTCPIGDLEDPVCLHNLGDRAGFITVYPNGTSARLLPKLRTWNAGGGGEYACSSGLACYRGIDDVAYLNAVLDQLEAEFRVDTSRVYFMGFSNGGALSHRVGCEMADRITAIAPVSGGNAFSTEAQCAPSRAVPVIYAHGTGDGCWTYESSTQACADESALPKIGAPESLGVWLASNECDAEPARSNIRNSRADGTTTDIATYTGCADGAEVRMLTINNGGHLFPGGNTRTLGGASGGSAPKDWNVEVLWDFLSRFAIA